MDLAKAPSLFKYRPIIEPSMTVPLNKRFAKYYHDSFVGQKYPICFMSPLIHRSGLETRDVSMAQWNFNCPLQLN